LCTAGRQDGTDHGDTREIGKETARGLVRLRASVVVVGRDEARGAVAARELPAPGAGTPEPGRKARQ
jgi:NAD(P)-dependent dehydrogenase (short-subunit alcohol dehydrogenase family)